MRLVVLSDSHRAKRKLDSIVQKHLTDADMFIFLGDGEADFDEILTYNPSIKYERVSGNCDWDSVYPTFKILDNIAGKRILITHGHPFQVKHGYTVIEEYAKKIGADIVLFGHTHIQYIQNEFENGFYMMNPGSAANGEYGMVDIEKSGVMLIDCKI